MVSHWGRRSGTWSRGLGEVCTQLLLPALPSALLQTITESQLGLTGSWVGAGSLHAGPSLGWAPGCFEGGVQAPEPSLARADHGTRALFTFLQQWERRAPEKPPK